MLQSIDGYVHLNTPKSPLRANLPDPNPLKEELSFKEEEELLQRCLFQQTNK